MPVMANTVTDVRALSTWPPGEGVLDVPSKVTTEQGRKDRVAFLYESVTPSSTRRHRIASHIAAVEAQKDFWLASTDLDAALIGGGVARDNASGATASRAGAAGE